MRRFADRLPRVSIFAVIVAALVFTVPVATQQQPRARGSSVVVNGRWAAADEVLVKYRDSTRADERLQLHQQLDVDEDIAIGSMGVRRVHSRFFDVDTLVRFLRADPRVEYVEPNYIVSIVASVPDDPQFGSLWGLRNLNQPSDIDAAEAWDISTGSAANVVGVVDSGVDYNHPDLAANMWSAPSSFNVTIAGKTITCAAGTHGFRSTNLGQMTCDPMDDNNHGTHVSGTIGAVGNNNVGVVGVNWTASIMGLKFLGSNGSGYTSDAINVIEFAVQAKTRFGASANVRVLSNSWSGGGFSQALLNAINKANTNGMLFVAAAGNNSANNDSTAIYPANYTAPNVVSVAATTIQDTLASFSNYGPSKVHLGAPGQGIISTTRLNTYSNFSGTSMATPHVAGAAALLLSVCPLDTAALKNTLLANVDQTLVGLVSTNGRLNVDKAIRACTEAAGNRAPVVTSVTPAAGSGASQTFTYQISDVDGFGDVAWAVILINGAPVTSNGCVVLAYPPANAFLLLNDAGTGWLTPLVAGSAGTLQNSQCAIAGPTSSMSGSGTTRTVNLALSFKPAFSGIKLHVARAADLGGLQSDWAPAYWVVP